jgi:cold shock CspA family protein
LQTTVKKWFREKNTGFLDNGSGPDILVNKDDLVNCQFLKVGVNVEFECHANNRGLVAKKVKLLPQKKTGGQGQGKRTEKPFRFGVMT